MPFKYEAGQVLVQRYCGEPGFYRVERRTACFMTLTPLEGQSNLLEKQPLSMKFEVVPTDTPKSDTKAQRWKIVVDDNGDETNLCGFALWDGKPVTWYLSNDD
jgi:hypothetical protein